MNKYSSPQWHLPGRLFPGVALSLVSVICGFAQTVNPNSVQSSDASNRGEVVKLDTFEVTGASFREEAAVRTRQHTLGMVDSLSMDDTGQLGDENLADALTQVVGVAQMQFFYGEQEAAFVTIRGLSADLNHTSIDGITMFSPANGGAGQRRVDLNLIPTQIAQRSEVSKIFLADMDAGMVGGALNIVPYSALNGHETFYVEAQGSLMTGYGESIPGTNAGGNYDDTPFGGAVKGLWVHRFGSKDQFGIVLSGTYNQRNYDYTKRNLNGITYNGVNAVTDPAQLNGYSPLPSLVRPMDYNHYSATYGGSMQLEWQATPDLQFSVLGFNYGKEEDMTRNQFYVRGFDSTTLTRPSQNVATLRVGSTEPYWWYDEFRPETRGVVAKMVKKFDPPYTSLEVRFGYDWNKFERSNQTIQYSYATPKSGPLVSNITFDTSRPSYEFTISNYENLLNTDNYNLAANSYIDILAVMQSREAKVDYKWNWSNESVGLGFSTGLNARKVKANNDDSRRVYDVPAGSRLGSMGFANDFHSFMWGPDYQYPWIDAAQFKRTVEPTLNLSDSRSSTQPWMSNADYAYDETVTAGYIQAMYATPTSFRAIAGLRYDNVDFTAYSPLRIKNVLQGTPSITEGGYDHLLPSLVLTQDFGRADGRQFRLKASYSQSLGRPNFEDVASVENRNDDALTITRGNPDLKPRSSDNFDAAVEYYFNEGRSGIMLSGFIKNITDDIYELTTQEDIDGVTYTVTQPNNVSEASVKGVEFNMTTAIPGMPGFLRDSLMVTGNVSRMWGDVDYRVGNNTFHYDNLAYQPTWIANASLVYTLPKKKGEIRIAYNWNDKSPVSFGATPTQTYWLESRGNLNASIRYSITDNLILQLRGLDLLQEIIAQDYYGDHYAYRRIEVTRPRSFQLSLTYTH